MRILVLIKQVGYIVGFSGTDPFLNYLEVKDTIHKINPYDIDALLTASMIKANLKNKVEIDCLSLVPPNFYQNLKSLYALGADNVYAVEFYSALDPISKAKVLATFVRVYSPDLILAGKQSIDTCHRQVPCRLAYELGLPFIDSVKDIEVSLHGRKAIITKESMGFKETYEVALPVVCSIETKRFNSHIIPGLKELEIREKEVKVLGSPCLEFKGNIFSKGCFFPKPKPKPIEAPSSKLSSFERMLALLSSKGPMRRTIRIKETPEVAAKEIIKFLKDKRVL